MISSFHLLGIRRKSNLMDKKFGSKLFLQLWEQEIHFPGFVFLSNTV